MELLRDFYKPSLACVWSMDMETFNYLSQNMNSAISRSSWKPSIYTKKHVHHKCSWSRPDGAVNVYGHPLFTEPSCPPVVHCLWKMDRYKFKKKYRKDKHQTNKRAYIGHYKPKKNDKGKNNYDRWSHPKNKQTENKNEK